MLLKKKISLGKLEELGPPSYSLGEDDESDSLQQSLGSKYAPNQLQQNNFGPRYTQSQLQKGPGSMLKACNLIYMMAYIFKFSLLTTNRRTALILCHCIQLLLAGQLSYGNVHQSVLFFH